MVIDTSTAGSIVRDVDPEMPLRVAVIVTVWLPKTADVDDQSHVPSSWRVTVPDEADSVTVSIEFTPKDKLKNVLRIELEVGDPKNPDIYAPLQITPKKYSLVTASFSASA